VDNLVIFC